MNFLFDTEEEKPLIPPVVHQPENNDDRIKSEYELRIERSLKSLNVPDWYQNASSRRNLRTPSAKKTLLSPSDKPPTDPKSRPRWTGLGSRNQYSSGRSNSAVLTKKSISREPINLESNDNTLLTAKNSSSLSVASSTSREMIDMSPYLWGNLSRWSSMRLSTTSVNSAASNSSNYRKPYLGWRAAAASSAASSRCVSPTPAASMSCLPRYTRQSGSALSLSFYASTPAISQEGYFGSQITSPQNPNMLGANLLSAVSQPTSPSFYNQKYTLRKPSDGYISPVPYNDSVASTSPQPRKSQNIWIESSFVGTKASVVPNNEKLEKMSSFDEAEFDLAFQGSLSEWLRKTLD